MEYLASLKMYKEGKIWREFERNSQTEIPLSLINDIGVERNCRGDRCVAKVEWPAAPSLSPLTSTVLLVAPSWCTLPSAPPPAATSLPPPPPSFFSGVHRSPPITHTCHLASLHPLKTLNAFLPRFFLSFFFFSSSPLRDENFFIEPSTNRETFLLPHFIFEVATFTWIDFTIIDVEEDRDKFFNRII